MLGQLAIRDVVLIDRLELEFEPGLGVLTGETGAGKSILLDSLGLALGARADSGLVRAGQDGANVSAELMLPAGHPALALLAEQGIEVEPGEPLVLRRTVTVERVLSDNGSAYKSRRFAKLLRRLRIKHVRTRPYTPRTNGKAERFIQTLLREWAYAFVYPSSQHRTRELQPWMYHYNFHRPHSAVSKKPPATRLGFDENNVLRNYI